ncbi:hypothetical protein T439DRAFT_357790 [Meredithblackwellia eburnea MCA 4105]
MQGNRHSEPARNPQHLRPLGGYWKDPYNNKYGRPTNEMDNVGVQSQSTSTESQGTPSPALSSPKHSPQSFLSRKYGEGSQSESPNIGRPQSRTRLSGERYMPPVSSRVSPQYSAATSDACQLVTDRQENLLIPRIRSSSELYALASWKEGVIQRNAETLSNIVIQLVLSCGVPDVAQTRQANAKFTKQAKKVIQTAGEYVDYLQIHCRGEWYRHNRGSVFLQTFGGQDLNRMITISVLKAGRSLLIHGHIRSMEKLQKEADDNGFENRLEEDSYPPTQNFRGPQTPRLPTSVDFRSAMLDLSVPSSEKERLELETQVVVKGVLLWKDNLQAMFTRRGALKGNQSVVIAVTKSKQDEFFARGLMVVRNLMEVQLLRELETMDTGKD